MELILLFIILDMNRLTLREVVYLSSFLNRCDFLIGIINLDGFIDILEIVETFNLFLFIHTLRHCDLFRIEQAFYVCCTVEDWGMEIILNIFKFGYVNILREQVDHILVL